MSAGFEWDDYQTFTEELWIDTKELGAIQLGKNRMGTQKRLLEEIKRGMSEGYREFVTLKGRQIGISTENLALDMYYAFHYPGTPGAIVLHTDRALDRFRATLDTYYDGLPDDWKIEKVQHNRNQLVLANRSIIQYMVAGETARGGGNLGRSSSIVFGHFTEVAFWGDESQLDSLRATMAKRNPTRFFHWETTANGHNFFQEMWLNAQEAATIYPIFIGWWANEFYRYERGSNEFDAYWGVHGRPTKDERNWMRRLALDYHYELTPEQIAWYRCYRAEHATSDLMMMQEYPTTPEEAFQSTASKFFHAAPMNKAISRVIHEKKPDCYQFSFGPEFTDTKVMKCSSNMAHLRVWEEPVEGAYYALGADPSYGASSNSDNSSIEVFRCYANRIEQVAEFSLADMNTDQFAWCIVYLAGAYKPCVYNCELNGPGRAVLNEIDKLKKKAAKSYIPGQAKTLTDVLRNVQAFYWIKEDSLMKRPQATHTVTTLAVKDSYMSMFRSNFENGILVVHSRQLLNEMSTVTRQGYEIRGEGNANDDRPIAAALANKAYSDQLLSLLIIRGVLWTAEPKAVEAKPNPQGAQVLSRRIGDYLEQIGLKHKPKSETPGVQAYNLPQQKFLGEVRERTL